MPENSQKVTDLSSEETVISINRNKEKRETTKYNKPHCIIPLEDMQWVINQAKSIQILWNECWASDQYGSRWMRLTTSLSDKAFRVARKILYTAGLFEFKRETCIDDTRKTANWVVINLHGARRIDDFWNKQEPIDGKNEPPISTVNELDSKNIPNNGQVIPISGKNIPIDGKKIPPIPSETLAITGVADSLSISSESSQELLNEVPEEELTTTNELVKRVRSRGTKLGEKLANVMERCMKLAKGESQDDFIGELFTTRYRWQIDHQRLTQFLNLTKECRIWFLEKFKYVYQNDCMNAPKTFDKAMTFVTNNVDAINHSVRLQMQAFDYQFTS